MPSPSSRLDAVTVDAFGTLVELVEPVERLAGALAAHGVERDAESVAAAFAAEVAYYVPRSHEGRDEESLADLRRRSAAVFLGGLGTDLDPEAFTPGFVGALAFRPLPGAIPALESLRAAGLSVACVSNWDVGLADHLASAGLAHLLSVVVTSADAGAPKPGAAIFGLAIGRLGVRSERALHVGDSDADREGAAAAGLAFEPVPLATLPARLGLGAHT